MIKSLHGNFTGCYKVSSETLERLGYLELHGWSHLDHDSLFGQVSLVTLRSLEPRSCFDYLLLFGSERGCWLVTFCSCVSLFGAGSLLNHISLFGPFGDVSHFGARSPRGSQGPKHNFVVKSLHGTFTEAPRGEAKFFPTAEQVGRCKWLAAGPRIALWTVWACVTI